MFETLWRWKEGRQQGGYKKMLLLSNSCLIPFDCYLLKYSEGSEVPEHTDPFSEKQHYRLNVILKNAVAGGKFTCENAIYSGRRVKLFRPDVSPHSVSRVVKGVRYVLSVGWVRSRIDEK